MKFKGRIAEILGSGVFTRGDAGYVVVLIALAALSALAPLLDDAGPIPLAGTMMFLASVVSLMYSLRRVKGNAFGSVYTTSGVTLLIGVLLMAAPAFDGEALRIFVGCIFVADALRRVVEVFRKDRERRRNILATIGNLAVGPIVFSTHHQLLVWTITTAGCVRILGLAWDLVTANVYGTADAGETVLRDLGIPDDPSIVAAMRRLMGEEKGKPKVWNCPFFLAGLLEWPNEEGGTFR